MFQAIYERMFSSIVRCINDAIELKRSGEGGSGQGQGHTTIIGVLDIYGFEIFDNNRFSFLKAQPTLSKISI